MIFPREDRDLIKKLNFLLLEEKNEKLASKEAIAILEHVGTIC